jgi:hypothetical protein
MTSNGIKDVVKSGSEKGAEKLSNVSEKLDPFPHYIMSGACFFASYFAHQRKNDPKTALTTGFFGLAYALSGYYLSKL